MKQKSSAGFWFRRLMSQGIVVAPGAFMPIVARQIEKARIGYNRKDVFVAVYISGAGLHQSLALPDEGILSRRQVAQMARRIIRATELPCIVDGDTGFDHEEGGVEKTVRELTRLGAAAIQIEDQVPQFKRCGHLPGKQVIPTAEMADKIRRAVAAKTDPDFLIIARTDARAVEGLEGAIARAHEYLVAGADIIFPEALESKEEFRAFRQAVLAAPLLANMTEDGKTPYLTVKEFAELGYNIVIFPMTCFRASMQAVDWALIALREHGTQRGLRKSGYLMPRGEVDKLLTK